MVKSLKFSFLNIFNNVLVYFVLMEKINLRKR